MRFIYFYLNLKKSLTGASLKISTLQGEVITTKEEDKNNRIFFSSYPIVIPIDYIKSRFANSLASGGKGTKGVSKGVIGILFLVSLKAAVIVVKLLQMLDFFEIFNVDPPSNLKAFMSLFDSNIFDFFPNIFYSEEAERECRIHFKLRENDIQCAGFNNVG